jgi:hypothetical protein
MGVLSIFANCGAGDDICTYESSALGSARGIDGAGDNLDIFESSGLTSVLGIEKAWALMDQVHVHVHSDRWACALYTTPALGLAMWVISLVGNKVSRVRACEHVARQTRNERRVLTHSVLCK